MKNTIILFSSLMLAACGGGGGGSGAFGPSLSAAQQANVVTASQAGLAASQSQTANASVSTALSNLSNLVSLNPTLSSNSTVTAAALTAQQAANLATSAQTSAAAAAADLMVASNVNIVGVVSAGRTICAATNSCTSAEIAALGYVAANTAKNAAEATLFALNATNQLKDIISTVAPTVNLTAATAAIATATSSASIAQATANTTITNYAAAAIQVGTPVITIAPSSGTTGSVEGTPTYSGNTQTIVTTFGNGQTATVTNQPTSSAVTWALDNVTRTTTYTFANGGTNAVVATVPGTVGTPSYNGNTQTIVTTFGNGQTSTANNTATGTPVVTWGSDNVTRTTTYTFANGGTNAVVATVPGTAGTPTYSGNTQTIVTTFGNGQTATVTNQPTSSAVTWASDNVTRTTTYTFANGSTNAVVATVPGTVGTPSYNGNTQTIVTTFGNGQTSTATNTATSTPVVTWGSDNVTRTTTYTFANGGTNAVVATVPGTAGTPTYNGNTQTILITFANGQTSTANNTPTGTAVTWASDNVTRTTTYTFANGGTNAVVATVPGTVGTPSYNGNTQTIVTTFGNGQTSTATNTATGTPVVTWGSDNVTRTTTYTFANGGTNAVVATVPGTAGTPTYSGNTQTIVTTFGNGQTATVTNQPTSSAVTWGSDNLTRTTTHTFANGGTNAVVDTVPGTVGTPTYSGATQTIVTTFGNGQTSTVTNAATGTPVVTWGSDNVTRTTTYTFANGGTNAVVATVPGIETGGVSTTINGIVSITPITIQYGSGVIVSTQDGTVLKPFIQSTLTSKNISDSNSFIQSSTDTYDLRWGVKASSFSMSTSNNVSAQTSSTLGLISLNGVYLGNYGTFSLNENFSFTSSLSSTSDGWQGTWITKDVKDAWYAGWSGKGIKIGIIDDFTANSISDFINLPLSTGCSTRNVQSTLISTCSNSNNIMIRATHGEQVAMIAGSSLSSLTGLITESGGWSDGFDLGSYNVVKNLNVNFSSPFYGVAKDATIYRDDFLTYQSNTLGLFSVLKNWSLGSDSSSNLFKNLHVLNMSLGGTSTNRVNNQSAYSNQLSYANSSAVPDVVFVKAAGNSSCVINQTNCDPLNAVLYNSPNYKNKSLIVGALDRAGGTIASYSNKAGAYSDIFLVADGRGLFNSTSNSYVEGTSFAAPRVSGYTAILRHKFPNLNAEKSASIMLDTARYDTMGCHPNCDPSIYGKGEASLSRALAPVGRLR